MAKKTVAKPAGIKKPKKAAASSPKPASAIDRRLKTPKYRSFRLHKRIKPAVPKLPGSFRLLGRSVKVLAQHWRLFLVVVLVYGVLNIIFVTGIGGTGDISTAQSNIKANSSGQGLTFGNGAALLGDLLGNSGNTNSSTAGTYQVLFLLIGSLAIIWTLRQVHAGKPVRARDSYYRGIYPLIPFILVLAVIGIQLLPFIVGAFLYSTVVSGGIAVLAVEKVAWAFVFFLLALLSLYMICSSFFALYIATLPDMTPMKALRSARQLVLYRRWSVMRKLLFLPVVLLMGASILMLPVVLFLAPAAVWIFFALGMIGLAIFHSYMYLLYRALL